MRKFYLVKSDDYQSVVGGEPKLWEGETAEEINPTGEELANWMDEEAENANYHSLCGEHIFLYELIKEKGGESVADEVFRALVEKRNWIGDT